MPYSPCVGKSGDAEVGTSTSASTVQTFPPVQLSSPGSPFSDSNLAVPITLTPVSHTNLSVTTHALLDSGATTCFISSKFAAQNSLPLVPRLSPLAVSNVEGRPLVSGPITHEVSLRLAIGQHNEVVSFAVIDTPYPAILGLSWLRLHSPRVDWARSVLEFTCCPDNSAPARQSDTPAPDVDQEPESPAPALSPSESDVRIATVSWDEIRAENDHVFIAIIQPYPDTAVIANAQGNPNLDPDDNPSDEPEDLDLIKKTLPADYHDLIEVFSPRSANTLAPHRPGVDMEIDLEENKSPPNQPLRPLSIDERKVLEDWINEELTKGFISESKSSAGAPILFARKKDGSLRLCHDFRGLNAITKKDRYPLPIINELLDRVHGSKIFTKLDLKTAYNLIRIAPGDEWKTAFKTHLGLFQMNVMPFGLSNAPACFQRFIDHVLAPRRGLDTSAYLDDILINNHDLSSHVPAVRHVLQLLLENGLFCNFKKCTFHAPEVEHLGYILGQTHIKMDPQKLVTVRDWPPPQSIKQVQSWLGFTNFYRRFVQGYARIAAPLNALTKKTSSPSRFVLTPEGLASFERLKESLLEAPVLQHFNHQQPIFVITDGSDYAISGIIHQHDDIKRLHPVAFYSRKMDPAEINYDAGDKEALAIVATFANFRAWLIGSPFTIVLYCDHLNLSSLMTTKTLNRRQVRWAQTLADFNFRFEHIPGVHNVADAPSRRPDYVPKEGDIHIAQNTTSLFPHSSFAHLSELHDTTTGTSSDVSLPVSASALYELPHADLANRIRTAQDIDEECKNQLELLNQRFSKENDWILHDDRIYIPEPLRLEILKKHHDAPPAGHPGRAVTLDLIRRNYSWPGLQRQVRLFVTSCDTCQRVKADHHKPYGLLQPLPVPSRPWEDLSWDLIVKLPISQGFDSIWVVVCRHIKAAHFIPCRESMSGDELASLFIREVYRLHGAPRTVVSDRGTTFVNGIFPAFLKRLGVEPLASTAYHPQTDGQTERINQPVEDYLRACVSYLQDDWVQYLPLCEFAYNNHKSKSTAISPFYGLYGFHPHSEPTNASAGSLPAADKRASDLELIHAEVSAELRHSQEDYARHYNRHVQEQPEYFKPGARVWLRRRHIKTKRPSDKLDYRKLGPFKIIEAVNNRAFRLDLPPSMSRLHPVFNVNLLEPYHDPSQIPGRVAPPPPPIDLDPDDTPWLEVDSLLDARRIGRRLEYLIHWKNTTPDEDSWVPISDLSTDLDEDIERFHRRHPQLPQPTRSELDTSFTNPRRLYTVPTKTTLSTGRVSKPRGARP